CRDVAMLGLPIEIAGVTVRQITIRDLLILLHSRSPFLTGAEVQPEDVAVILHLLSPGFDPSPEARAKTMETIADVPFVRARDQLHALIDATFSDRPATSGPDRAAIVSFAASMVHPIAAAYGWPDEVLDAKGKPIQGAGILDKPIARIYQYFRLIQQDADPSVKFINPASDKARRLAVAAWRKKQKRRKAKTAKSFAALMEIPDVRKEEK
ncbi:MAG: hypothetical protein V4710_00755, partial [Verrucomicrobiota bacterium]